MATHSGILAWEIPCPWGCKESDMAEQLNSPSGDGCSVNRYKEEEGKEENREGETRKLAFWPLYLGPLT